MCIIRGTAAWLFFLMALTAMFPDWDMQMTEQQYWTFMAATLGMSLMLTHTENK